MTQSSEVGFDASSKSPNVTSTVQNSSGPVSVSPVPLPTQAPASLSQPPNSPSVGPNITVPCNKHPLFYINKDGFPVSQENLEKMFNFCLDRTKNSNFEIYSEILKISQLNLKNFKKYSIPAKPPVWIGPGSGLGGLAHRVSDFESRATPNLELADISRSSFISLLRDSSNQHHNHQSHQNNQNNQNNQNHQNWSSSLDRPLSQNSGAVGGGAVASPYAPSLPFNAQASPADIALFTSKVQKFMKNLKYNFTGMQFYDINKSRSLKYLLEIAATMIKLSLPIKCLEAVILGIHLTNPCPNQLVRFTLSFKSSCKKTKSKHYHVLLGLYNKKLGYGCIGMSRKNELAYKRLGDFENLEALIIDIKKSYESCGHILKRVSFGLPITHDSCSLESLDWTSVVVDLKADSTVEELSSKTERFSRLMRITVKDH